MRYRSLILAVLFASLSFTVTAQTTRFSFQGKLTDQGAPASGSYLLRFKMFDAPSAGTQVGSTLDDVSVSVSQGIFTTMLDFGASAFTGSDRYLEIAVRRNTGETYVTLTPREQIASSPYSVKAISAVQADSALNSDKLGGLDANQYVQQTDARLTDARNPLAGSSNYIQNGSTQQSGNFNISGNGTIAGRLAVGSPNPQLGLDGISSTVLSDAVAVYGSSASGNAIWGVTNTGYAGAFSGRVVIFGNTGIGVNSPAAKLHVLFNGTPTSGNNTALLEAPSIGPNASHIHYGTNGDWFVRSAKSGGKLVFQDILGLVGVGTNNPFAKLHVRGDSSGQGDTTAWFDSPRGGNSSAIHYGPSADWYIRSAAGNGRVIIQDTGGNAGVGTSDPRSKLHVANGNIFISQPNSLVITSPNGACWFITVSNTGGLSSFNVACP